MPIISYLDAAQTNVILSIGCKGIKLYKNRYGKTGECTLEYLLSILSEEFKPFSSIINACKNKIYKIKAFI